MESRFLTNYTETTFLSTIQMNLRRCKSFAFSQLYQESRPGTLG